MYPMKMIPAYKDYLWGGNKMKKLYNKENDLAVTAESWELSCHKDGLSRIANGQYAGQTLQEVIKQRPEFVSDTFSQDMEFPILIKLIDAEKDLSIQVHPSDETADYETGERGKAEMWYIVKSEPQSYIYYGLKKRVTAEQLRSGAEDGTVCDVLNKVTVKAGDIFFINPGTIHALGKGIIAAEIQQNSNTTFRLFDYGRVGADGKKRELNLGRASMVTDYTPVIPEKSGGNHIFSTEGYDFSNIFSCEYFKVFRLRCNCSVENDSHSNDMGSNANAGHGHSHGADTGICDSAGHGITNNNNREITFNCGKDSFHALLVINGCGEINCNGQKYSFNPGDCYFIPAGIGEYTVEPKEAAEILLSKVLQPM